jgi:glycosyltransferase involved in cell wall biosynthesis
MFRILHTEASLGWGGQEIRIVHEAAGIAARGNHVMIAAPENSVILGRAREAGIEVFPAGFNKRNPLSVRAMMALIDRLRPDILNTHSSADSWVSALAARLSRSRPKIIRTRHLSTPISRSLLSRVIYDILPDAVITTGEEIRWMMIERNRFDGGRIVSIPTGVDLVRFDIARVQPVLPAKGFTAGMVGVLRSWKGHGYFIRAVPAILKKIPRATFYIAGDGPQYDNIRKMITELDLEDKVILLGHREDIPEVLASLDVVVQPSYANEGIPQSVLQAMAMERPVVASDAGAIKEVVIDGKTGFLTAPKDPAGLAEKIIRLYEGPSLRAAFGRAGRMLVEKNHSVGHMLDRIESLYGALARKRPR